MAAATVTGRGRNNVSGHQRVVTAASIVFASNSDTWAVPGMKTIFEISLTPTTNISPSFTVSGNVITAITAGTYRGSVYGL